MFSVILAAEKLYYSNKDFAMVLPAALIYSIYSQFKVRCRSKISRYRRSKEGIYGIFCAVSIRECSSWHDVYTTFHSFEDASRSDREMREATILYDSCSSDGRTWFTAKALINRAIPCVKGRCRHVI